MCVFVVVAVFNYFITLKIFSGESEAYAITDLGKSENNLWVSVFSLSTMWVLENKLRS